MPSPQVIDWYDAPLYYDIAFQSLTAAEVEFLDGIYREHAPAGARLLEPACGSGRLLEGLAARGYRVSGFDRSRAMLDFARRRMARAGLAADLFAADLASFRVEPRFQLAFCMVNSFKYLLEDAGARAHLRAVAAALSPGGIYVLGLHLSEYVGEEEAEEHWTGERDGVRVRCAVKSWPADRRGRRERVRSRLEVEDGGAPRSYETEWEFRTYSAAQLRGLLAGAGAFEHLATYGFDYDLSRPRELGAEDLDAVVVLRRR